MWLHTAMQSSTAARRVGVSARLKPVPLIVCQACHQSRQPEQPHYTRIQTVHALLTDAIVPLHVLDISVRDFGTRFVWILACEIAVRDAGIAAVT